MLNPSPTEADVGTCDDFAASKYEAVKLAAFAGKIQVATSVATSSTLSSAGGNPDGRNGNIIEMDFADVSSQQLRQCMEATFESRAGSTKMLGGKCTPELVCWATEEMRKVIGPIMPIKG